MKTATGCESEQVFQSLWHEEGTLPRAQSWILHHCITWVM